MLSGNKFPFNETGSERETKSIYTLKVTAAMFIKTDGMMTKSFKMKTPYFWCRTLISLNILSVSRLNILSVFWLYTHILVIIVMDFIQFFVFYSINRGPP